MKKLVLSAAIILPFYLGACEKSNPSPKCADTVTLDIVKQFLKEKKYLYMVPKALGTGMNEPEDFKIDGIVTLGSINMDRGYSCRASAKGINIENDLSKKVIELQKSRGNVSKNWKPESDERSILYKVYVSDDNQTMVSMPRN